MAILAVSVAFGFQPKAPGPWRSALGARPRADLVGLKAQPASGAQLPAQPDPWRQGLRSHEFTQ